MDVVERRLVLRNIALPFNRLTTGSAFSPADIAGLQLWLKADGTLWQDSARTTPAVADGVVGAWDDASGNGNHATQATTSKKPLLKLNIVNGKPVVRFDDVDDWMATASGVSIDNDYVTFIFVAAAHTTTMANRHAFLQAATTAPYTYWHISQENNNNAAIYSFWGDGANWDSLVAGPKTTAFGVRTITCDTANRTAYINGQFKSQTSVTRTIVDSSGIGIGAAGGYKNPADMDMAEVIIYDSPLSDSQRQQVENYLNEKYNVY